MDHNSVRQTSIVYFSHGGGPLPLLGEPGHKAMVNFMARLPALLKKPEVILVISAHWEEEIATLTSSPAPSLLYDYYGFPDAAYEITYPAPGSPELAQKIAAELKKNGLAVRLDAQRGFDHGLFVPLKMMYPQAEIPCLQLSLLNSLDPQAHLDLGKALAGLLSENILVIGSGFSFHNLRAFSWQGTPAPDPANDAFQNWLIETCTAPLPPAEREDRLAHWKNAPSARYCHPREDHLLPLHVCQGLAQKPARVIFDDLILGKRSIAFLWE